MIGSGRQRMALAAGRQVCLVALSAVFAGLLVAAAFVDRSLAGPPGDIAFATALVGCAVLLAPRPSVGRLARALMPWSWGLLLVAACAAIGRVAGRPGLAAPGLLLAVYCTWVALGSISNVANARDALRDLGRPATIVVAATLALAPLWLAPAAEATAPDMALANLAVAISPLSFISMGADFDYLRTAWFYEHSALGSLRYEYPPMAACVAICLALGICGSAVAFRRSSTKSGPSTASPPLADHIRQQPRRIEA